MFTPSGLRDIGIRKFEFVAKTQSILCMFSVHSNMSCLQIVEKSDSWFAIILFLLIIYRYQLIAFIVDAKIKCNLYIHQIA